MRISVTKKEWSNIMQLVESFNTNAIYFIKPNAVFIISKKNDQDYAFFNFPITVDQSVVLPKTAYRNIHRYLLQAMRAYSDRYSVFYNEVIASMEITGNGIFFNDRSDLFVRVDIPFSIIPNGVNDRLPEVMKSSDLEDSPSISFSYKAFLALNKTLTKMKKRYLYRTIYVSSDNLIRIEDGEVVVYSKHKTRDEGDIPIRLETGISHFTESKVARESYAFTDKSFRIMFQLRKSVLVEEVILFPREDHCIVEMRVSGMVGKVRTKIKNDIDMEKAL